MFDSGQTLKPTTAGRSDNSTPMDDHIPQSHLLSYDDHQQQVPIFTGTSAMTGHYAYDRDRL